MIERRDALKLFGGAGLAALTAKPLSALAASAGSTTEPDSCDPIPEETAGPFPGDGSNGPNVLATEDVLRSDITSSFGSAKGVAEGVPLTVTLTVTDSASGCAPLPGAALYLWHCDREGRYSIYSEGVTEENYLRGVQGADEDGVVTFQTIFPGTYPGRWPHLHFEVYASLDDALGGGDIVATSQLAFPKETCDEVYEAARYEDSVGNLAALSLETDGVFRDDGAEHQLGTVTGTIDDEDDPLTVELTVAV